MKYDIFNDGLIVLWKNGSPIVIDSKKVDEFTIVYNGIPRRFVNLRETYPGIRGFAEIMYQGASPVIAKHIKVVSKNPAGCKLCGVQGGNEILPGAERKLLSRLKTDRHFLISWANMKFLLKNI